MLDRFEEGRDTLSEGPRQPALTKDLALSFLPRLNVNQYDAERNRLLSFCLREAIVPEELAEAAGEFTGGWEELGAAWARSLTEDWPLRYVCRACRLFWA